MNAFLCHKVLAHARVLAAITLRIKNEEAWSYGLVLAKKNKGDIQILAQYDEVVDENELKKLLPAKAAISLYLEGQGILVKQASFSETGELVGGFDGDLDDFVLKPMLSREAREGFVAVIRSQLFQKILDHFDILKIHLVSVEIAPFSIKYLSPYLSDLEEVFAGSWKIELHQGEFVSFQGQHKIQNIKYQFGDNSISSMNLPAYAQLYQWGKGFFNSDSLDEVLHKEFIYSRLSLYLLSGVLSVLFLVLTFNFFLIESYREEYNQLSREHMIHESEIKKAQKLEEELKHKSILIKQAGLEENTHFSWCLDQLLESMPHELTLTALFVNPLQGNIKSGDEIHFQQNTIEIKGSTTEDSAVYQWMRSIGEEPWVNKVELIDFQREEENKDAFFNLFLSY